MYIYNANGERLQVSLNRYITIIQFRSQKGILNMPWSNYNVNISSIDSSRKNFNNYRVMIHIPFKHLQKELIVKLIVSWIDLFLFYRWVGTDATVAILDDS